MKRVKLFALAACLAALSMVLCSCNYLDRIKLDRAEEIDATTIRVGGQTYTQVAPVPYHYTAFEGYSTIWFAEDEVPLLLTRDFGYATTMTWDEKAFVHEGYIYAREDVTEAERTALRNVKLDRFCIGYYIYMRPGTERLLSDELTAAIKQIMAGPSYEGMPSDSEESGVKGMDYYTSEEFCACDAKVYFIDGEYCFSIYEDGSMFLMDWNAFRFYKVPDKYAALVKAFAEKYSSEMPVPTMIEGY